MSSRASIPSLEGMSRYGTPRVTRICSKESPRITSNLSDDYSVIAVHTPPVLPRLPPNKVVFTYGKNVLRATHNTAEKWRKPETQRGHEHEQEKLSPGPPHQRSTKRFMKSRGDIVGEIRGLRRGTSEVPVTSGDANQVQGSVKSGRTMTDPEIFTTKISCETPILGRGTP